MCATLGVGPTANVMTIFCIVEGVFYMAQWEEYHTGTLQWSNGYMGVTESQLIQMGLFVVTACFGERTLLYSRMYVAFKPYVPGRLLSVGAKGRTHLVQFVYVVRGLMMLSYVLVTVCVSLQNCSSRVVLAPQCCDPRGVCASVCASANPEALCILSYFPR